MYCVCGVCRMWGDMCCDVYCLLCVACYALRIIRVACCILSVMFSYVLRVVCFV